MDFDSMLLGKIKESIRGALPDPKKYTGEAYIQLIDDVIHEVFASRVEYAVLRAGTKLRWNEELGQYEVKRPKE